MGSTLPRIEGIGPYLALAVMAEIGTDMGRWPTVWHFCSWLGLSPAEKKSGGKILGSATKKVKSRVAWAFRMATSALRRSRSALGEFYRKMRQRQGPWKAIASTAHKLARLVYSLLRNGQEYVARTMAEMEEKKERRAMDRIERQAARRGLKLVPIG
jgi:hypothetical protein